MNFGAIELKPCVVRKPPETGQHVLYHYSLVIPGSEQLDFRISAEGAGTEREGIEMDLATVAR